MEGRINGAATLANMAFGMSENTLRKERVAKNEVTKIADTLRAIPWSREAISLIRSNRINKLLQSMRNAKIDQAQYSAIVQILQDPIGADSLDKATWALWGDLTLKYIIQGTMTHTDVSRTIMSLTQGAIKTPLDLAQISKADVLSLDAALFAHGEVALFWQCAKCHLEYQTGRVTKTIP